MKYLKYTFLLMALPFCWYACEYERLKTFDGNADVYFTALRDANAYNDSIAMNFFFFQGNIQDTTLTLSVTVTGGLSAVDRYVSIKANEQSTAVESVHYTMPNSIKIAAGAVNGTVRVTIHRAADLKIPGTLPKVLILSLMPNEEFGINIKRELRRNKNTDTISVLDYKIIFADLMKQPKYWDMNVFGTYSDKKFLLVCERNNIAPAYIDGQVIDGETMTPGEAYTYALITQSYLNEQAAAGHPVYESDGVTLMRMGDAVKN